MTRRLTPAEQLAADARNTTLAQLLASTDPAGWNLALVKQAILAAGRSMPEFSANDFRDLLPEMGAGMAGLACHALRIQGLIEPTGARVPSTLASTHGHGIHVYRLTTKARTAGTEAAA
ncbi:hypothetical protein [Streptomyces sp. NRRL F-5630]|uniref:hypothetical protein n=1 Tax=Streptomyces sp. NRRL F-5630 TaxID=1463864 RepID=UPI003EB922B9